jgi:hypothetical protein
MKIVIRGVAHTLVFPLPELFPKECERALGRRTMKAIPEAAPLRAI